MSFHPFKATLAVAFLLSLAIMVLPEGDGLEVTDHSFLVDLYDETTMRYAGIDTGEEVTFIDIVATSDYYIIDDDMGITKVWLVSTGGSPDSPTLSFPSDKRDIFLTGAKIMFTVTIKEGGSGNDTYQYIDADIVNIEVIEEGDPPGAVEKDIIEVFGVEIQKEDLPSFLQSDWARFGVAVGIWIIMIVIIWFIFRLLLMLTKKTKRGMAEAIVNITRLPFFLLLLIYGIIVSLSQLEVPGEIIGILDTAYKAMAIIILAVIAVKLFKKVIMVYLTILSKETETQADDVLVPVFGKLMTVVIWVAAAIMFFRTFGFDATALLGAVGVVGLVIAFAAQDTLSNFFSGIMILLDRPFKEGDWIIMDESVYQVKDIGLRSTRLFHSFSNQMVTIPNSKMSNLTFSNLTEPDKYGRKTVKFGVSYDCDLEKVEKVAMEVVRSHPSVHEDKDHSILFRFNEFGDSSINFAVTFFVQDYNDQWAVASDLRDRLFRKFGEESIEIPFPQRVIHMKGYENGTEKIGSKHNIRAPSNMKNLSP